MRALWADEHHRLLAIIPPCVHDIGELIVLGIPLGTISPMVFGQEILADGAQAPGHAIEQRSGSFTIALRTNAVSLASIVANFIRRRRDAPRTRSDRRRGGMLCLIDQHHSSPPTQRLRRDESPAKCLSHRNDAC